MRRRNRLPALVLFALCAVGAGSLLNAPNAWSLVKRAINLVSGTGATASCVDNFTTGQQDCTISATGSPPTGTASGDLSGTYPGPEVTGLINHALPALASGCLDYTGSAWTFTSCSGGGSSVTGTGIWYSTSGSLNSAAVVLDGDVVESPLSAGAIPLEVTGLENKALPSLPGSANCLEYTGSAWAFTGCGSGGVTLASGSGIAVTGGPAYTVALSVPCAAPNGCTGVVSPTAHNVPIAEGSSAFNLAAPSTAGGLLASNGASSDPSFSTLSGDVTCGTPSGSSIPCTVGRVRGITVSAQTQLVGRAIVNTDGVTPPTLTTWAFATPATVTQNTVTQFTSSSVTWSTSLASGVLSVLSTPTSPSAPVFEITGFQAGDNVVLRLDTTDASFGAGGHQDETLILAYCFSSGTCTFPTGFVTQSQESNLSALSLSDNYQVTAHGFVASAASGSNLFIEPVVGNVHTSASTQFTVLGGNTTLTVEAWR